jgi:uncharacterized protein (TIGR02246 family)
MNEDEKKIREVIATWMRATAEGDMDRVLSLMAEDVVFLIAGQPPMRGREAFAAASRAAEGKFHFEGKPDIQEINVEGKYAYCWNHFTVTITPLQGGAPSQRAGYILSIFRQEPDGRWVLFRDANMLTAV